MDVKEHVTDVDGEVFFPDPPPVPEPPLDDGWEEYREQLIASGAVTSPLQRMNLAYIEEQARTAQRITDLVRERNQARWVAIVIAVLSAVALVAVTVGIGG